MELMHWLFFGPALLIARWPNAGMVIAGLAILLQLFLGWRAGQRFDRNFFRQAPVFAGLLWLIFGFYEAQMQAMMGRDNMAAAPNSWLRLDLIVLTPILYLLTGAAVHAVIRQFKTKK
ncbi:MAG TPA: hypothetical protein VF928_16720 [Usitatibacteraceae bacterium]